jgi:tetratricopeptide (TPR) repeat protein
MRNVVRLLALVTLVVLALSPAYATCGGGGGGGMGGTMPGGMSRPEAYVVPWKVLRPDEPAVSAPLTLYWFPATKEEVKGSDMMSSRALTLASSQCIAMALVVPGDTETLAKWQVADKLPVAILAANGAVVTRIDSENGRLRLNKVEDAVRAELRSRETTLDKLLDDAKQKEKADHDGAVTLYQQVWDQRCIAPKKARAAQKALTRLGITVTDAELRTTDPIDTPRMNEKMTAAMNRAFAAELSENYARARALYTAAAKLDPADPVPQRFLGELLRHHTGEWALAKQTFAHLLTMQPDPLSRAVALHGLGKMTIHMGDSAKGLALFEQSIAAYPLALTYRNLAVYWNSERVRDKAEGYVQKALALDPDDPYNLVFAATYLADSGRAAEALEIAKKHEDLLAASYNLAAIYALLGQKGKAMELLHRHFYQYERYDDVRAMEMWEARVDYVFSSLKNDDEFVKLTAMAR